MPPDWAACEERSSQSWLLQMPPLGLRILEKAPSACQADIAGLSGQCTGKCHRAAPPARRVEHLELQECPTCWAEGGLGSVTHLPFTMQRALHPTFTPLAPFLLLENLFIKLPSLFWVSAGPGVHTCPLQVAGVSAPQECSNLTEPSAMWT